MARPLGALHNGEAHAEPAFAPARGIITQQLAGAPLNAGFVSELEAQIQRWQPERWLHGHCQERLYSAFGPAQRRQVAPSGTTPRLPQPWSGQAIFELFEFHV